MHVDDQQETVFLMPINQLLLVIQFQPAEIILAKDEEVRPLYYDNGSDGVWVNLPKSIYTKLNVSVDDSIQRTGPMLSERIKETYENYIMSYTY